MWDLPNGWEESHTRRLETRRRLEIPLHSGEDAFGWLLRVERYFKINGVPDADKLEMALVAMEGAALNWFH